jgi:hypothetical protein
MQKRFNPDEIRATKISLGRLGRQMNSDEHGLKNYNLVRLGRVERRKAWKRGGLKVENRRHQVAFSKFREIGGRSFRACRSYNKENGT